MSNESKEIEGAITYYSTSSWIESRNTAHSEVPYGDYQLIMNPAIYRCELCPISNTPSEDPDFQHADIMPAMMDESMKETYCDATERYSNAPTETSIPEPVPLSVPLPVPETREGPLPQETPAPDFATLPAPAPVDFQGAPQVPGPVANPAREMQVDQLPPGLEAQLDFIIESTKKHPKARNGGIKRVKAHKKPEQLAVLHSQFGDLTTITRDQIRAVARQTGLKEVQVYKWTWDQRRKVN